MPEIVFKGKEYVYNHHLTVPYRPLVVDAAEGIGPGHLNGNLVFTAMTCMPSKAYCLSAKYVPTCRSKSAIEFESL